MKKRILFFSAAWSTEDVFSPQIKLLCDQYDIVTPDIHQFNNIRDMSDYVINEYQNVYALIGLSMGGFVVQDILTREPSFASKAVLIGTHAHSTPKGGKEFLKGLIDQVRHGKLEELCQLYAEAVLSQDSQKNKTLVELVKTFPLKLGAEKCINHHQACINWEDHTDLLKNITADALILAGEHDAVVSLESQKTLQKLISKAKLEAIKNAGHLVTLENSEQVNEVILNFFNIP